MSPKIEENIQRFLLVILVILTVFCVGVQVGLYVGHSQVRQEARNEYPR
jgi:hypothetical protein